jgi:peptide/nickel transport system substrate-binding protein
VTAGIRGEPPWIYYYFIESSPGGDAVEELLGAALTTFNNGDRLIPQLAEAVPSLENGLWKLFPDGRMETTWRIKSNARWHDGTPVTSDDLLFTTQVGQDRELPLRIDGAYRHIDAIEVPDARTVTVQWKSTFIDADQLFTHQHAIPLPKHILQGPYAESKERFMQHPYWREEYVGAGPYKLREWVRGSHMLVEANDDYVLGRPKIDRIEVRFISDPNAMVASILAGEVDLTMGRGLTLDDTMVLSQRWSEGRVDNILKNWIILHPQFIDPNPPIVANLQLRRALLHATDREQMADTLLGGLTSAAHCYLGPNQIPEERELCARVPRYEYDPRKAAQMIEGLGYTRGPDGLFVDARGQRIEVEIRTSGGDHLHERTQLALADQWKLAGVDGKPYIVPDVLTKAQAAEAEANRTGFLLIRSANDVGANPFNRMHSSNMPKRETQWIGNNRSRYASPELDELIERYAVTVAQTERVQLTGQIIYHVADQLNLMGLYYNVQQTPIAKKLLNVSGASRDSTEAWNAQAWDLMP